MTAWIGALLTGVMFGLGLLGAGMTSPHKVKAFLDVAGAWDPSLGLVMGGAIAVTLPAFAWAKGRRRAWSGASMAWPSATVIDWRLLGGGALFGVGWGLAGFCPGPAVVAAGAGSPAALIFGGAMLAGMALHDSLLAPSQT